MDVLFCFDKGRECWDLPTLHHKLVNLTSARKEKHWIHQNLSLSESSAIGRSFWKLAQHFNGLRQLYGINPAYSKYLLEKMWKVIKDVPDEGLKRCYWQAVANFKTITGHSPQVESLWGERNPSFFIGQERPPRLVSSFSSKPSLPSIFPRPVPSIRVLPGPSRHRFVKPVRERGQKRQIPGAGHFAPGERFVTPRTIEVPLVNRPRDPRPSERVPVKQRVMVPLASERVKRAPDACSNGGFQPGERVVPGGRR